MASGTAEERAFELSGMDESNVPDLAKMFVVYVESLGEEIDDSRLFAYRWYAKCVEELPSFTIETVDRDFTWWFYDRCESVKRRIEAKRLAERTVHVRLLKAERAFRNMLGPIVDKVWLQEVCQDKTVSTQWLQFQVAGVEQSFRDQIDLEGMTLVLQLVTGRCVIVECSSWLETATIRSFDITKLNPVEPDAVG